MREQRGHLLRYKQFIGFEKHLMKNVTCEACTILHYDNKGRKQGAVEASVLLSGKENIPEIHLLHKGT